MGITPPPLLIKLKGTYVNNNIIVFPTHFLQALAGVEAPQPCDDPHTLDILSSLPLSVHPRLELQLDSDHKGVETDLYQIAHHMIDWEEKLVPHLGLTPVDVSDIKESHSNKPALQRYEE